jgi:hypothetical protein
VRPGPGRVRTRTGLPVPDVTSPVTVPGN